MTRAASSAAGSFALPRAITLSDTQQQQQLGLAAVSSWKLPQQQLEQQQQQQQQQQEPWSLCDPAQSRLPVEPSSNWVAACIHEAPHPQHQQQQQYLQVPDDAPTELRQQLAWQAQQQQQECQQLPDAPHNAGAHSSQQLALQAIQQQQQQTAVLQPSPAAASPAARRIVHSSSVSSSGSGLASNSSSGSSTGLAALGLHRPVARTNSMQQLMDAAGTAAANAAAGGGSVTADGAAAAAVAYKQWHANVSVLFADVQGYTELADKVEPEQVGRIACKPYNKAASSHCLLAHLLAHLLTWCLEGISTTRALVVAMPMLPVFTRMGGWQHGYMALSVA
jgi:hypothetical protein